MRTAMPSQLPVPLHLVACTGHKKAECSSELLLAKDLGVSASAATIASSGDAPEKATPHA